MMNNFIPAFLEDLYNRRGACQTTPNQTDRRRTPSTRSDPRRGKRVKPPTLSAPWPCSFPTRGRTAQGMKDADIRLTSGMKPSTLERLRKRCCEVGRLARSSANHVKPRQPNPRSPGRSRPASPDSPAPSLLPDMSAGRFVFLPDISWKLKSSTASRTSPWVLF